MPYARCSSYVEDPKWQRKFSIIWASLAGVAILASTPHLLNSIRRGRAFKGFFGVSETFGRKNYSPMVSEEKMPERSSRRLSALLQSIASIRLFSLPGLELNMGQSALNHFHNSAQVLTSFSNLSHRRSGLLGHCSCVHHPECPPCR
jgi:hypothetical protein